MAPSVQTSNKLELGSTFVEYALIVSCMALVALVSISVVGNQASTTFSTTARAMGGGCSVNNASALTDALNGQYPNCP